MDTAVDIHLDNDEMAYVLDCLDIDELPGVVDWRQPYRDESERRRAVDRVLPELRARGVIDDAGAVEHAVARCVRTLSRPLWDLEIRTVTRTPAGPQVTRQCVSAGTDGRFGVDRTPTGYWIRTAHGASAINTSAALRFSGLSAPRDTMTAALDRPATSTWVSIGCDETTAAILGEALSTCDTHVEIVLVGHRGAVHERIGTPIALFDTPRGRVLATTSFAADGTAWSSLAPGTDTRIRAEISSLIALF